MNRARLRVDHDRGLDLLLRKALHLKDTATTRFAFQKATRSEKVPQTPPADRSTFHQKDPGCGSRLIERLGRREDERLERGAGGQLDDGVGVVNHALKHRLRRLQGAEERLHHRSAGLVLLADTPWPVVLRQYGCREGSAVA